MNEQSREASQGGPLMVGVQGLTLADAERRLLALPAVSGVLLFVRNYADRVQLRALCDAIHSVPRASPLLVAVDQEGGRVQRFREGFTILPALGHFGDLHGRNAQRAIDLARETGWLLATELRACGVDFSFAPVLDVRDDRSRVIAARAFHRDQDVVIELAHAFIAGLREAGMAAVAKHFPGHGSVLEDSHLELPVDAREVEMIRATDLRPFAALAATGQLAGMLAAHVRYPAVDEAPASFSARWLHDILRTELGFDGAVFSDDLGMHAADVAGHVAQRIEACLAAGCDVALACNESVEVMTQIAQRWQPDAAQDQRRCERLARMVPANGVIENAPRQSDVRRLLTASLEYLTPAQ